MSQSETEYLHMQFHNVIDCFNISKCCGCGNCIIACPKKALSYSVNENGFIVPKINPELCVNCSLCVSVCPYNSSHNTNSPLNCYVALNKDPSVVKNSSSGGVFFELASEILNQGGVVSGAVFDSDYKVHHICVENINDLIKIMKSKYVQSFLDSVFVELKKQLDTKRVVLFSGTPCQVTALKTFLRKDYENLYTVDVACHGVPSQSMFDDYLKNLRGKKKITNFTFRYKKDAKNGMNAFISYEMNGKRIVKNWIDDSYHYFFMHSFSGRDSCYSCEFSQRLRDSDITLCDYWGWENHHRDNFDKNDSVSGIIVNSRKGLALLESVKHELKTVPTEYRWIIENNKSISSNVANQKRDDFFEMYRKNGYKKIESVFRKKTFIKRLFFRFKSLGRFFTGRR